jgi:hypothetical protein
MRKSRIRGRNDSHWHRYCAVKSWETARGQVEKRFGGVDFWREIEVPDIISADVPPVGVSSWLQCLG